LKFKRDSVAEIVHMRGEIAQALERAELQVQQFKRP